MFATRRQLVSSLWMREEEEEWEGEWRCGLGFYYITAELLGWLVGAAVACVDLESVPGVEVGVDVELLPPLVFEPVPPLLTTTPSLATHVSAIFSRSDRYCYCHPTPPGQRRSEAQNDLQGCLAAAALGSEGRGGCSRPPSVAAGSIVPWEPVNDGLNARMSLASQKGKSCSLHRVFSSKHGPLVPDECICNVGNDPGLRHRGIMGIVESRASVGVTII